MCEAAALTRSGSAGASAPSTDLERPVTDDRAWSPPAGGRGLRNEPSGAFTVIGRRAPSFIGPSGSVRHFTAA